MAIMVSHGCIEAQGGTPINICTQLPIPPIEDKKQSESTLRDLDLLPLFLWKTNLSQIGATKLGNRSGSSLSFLFFSMV